MDDMRRQAIRSVMELVTGAMRRGYNFDKILHIENSGPIIMNVFVKGNAGGLLCPTRRAALDEQFADDIDVPFVPRSWKMHAAGKVMDVVATMLESAIMETYLAALEHVEIATKRELAVASASRTAHEARRIVRRQMASCLHEQWRDTRRREDGEYEPRVKLVEGAEYDIANLGFDDLPSQFQTSNLHAADTACSFVEQALALGEDISSRSFLERASDNQHVDWLKENPWADDPLQTCPYDELSEAQKEKDRVIVRLAISLTQRYRELLARAQRSAQRSSVRRYWTMNGASATGLADADGDADAASQSRRFTSSSEVAAKAAAAAEQRAKDAHEAEEVVAAEAAVPFDMRVRAALAKELEKHVPSSLLLPTRVIDDMVFGAIDLALASTFNAQHMNASVAYLLDQYRLAIRLRGMAEGARALFLRRKEKIIATILSFQDAMADMDGAAVSREQLREGLITSLGLALSPSEADDVFDKFDVSGDAVLRADDLETALFGRSASVAIEV